MYIYICWVIAGDRTPELKVTTDPDATRLQGLVANLFMI